MDGLYELPRFALHRSIVYIVGHARKMVRALIEEAQPAGKAPEVHYWENVEGGHGGAADNKQRAHMWALTYSMLKQTLGL